MWLDWRIQNAHEMVYWKESTDEKKKRKVDVKRWK